MREALKQVRARCQALFLIFMTSPPETWIFSKEWIGQKWRKLNLLSSFFPISPKFIRTRYQSRGGGFPFKIAFYINTCPAFSPLPALFSHLIHRLSLTPVKSYLLVNCSPEDEFLYSKMDLGLIRVDLTICFACLPPSSCVLIGLSFNLKRNRSIGTWIIIAWQQKLKRHHLSSVVKQQLQEADVGAQQLAAGDRSMWISPNFSIF